MQRDATFNSASVLRAPLATIGESEPNDTLSEANLVSLGDTLSGVINPAGDFDYYAIDLEAGTVVDLDVDASELGSAIDPVIALFDVDSTTILAWNDDAGSLDSRIVFALPASGRYFVGITDLGLRGGSNYTYTLKFGSTTFTDTEPNDVPANATPITLGDTATGAVHSPGDIDYYAFDVPSPMMVVITAETWDYGSYLEFSLTLFDTDGTTALTQLDPYSGYPRIQHMLEASGRYFMAISSAYGNTGMYRLATEAMEPGPGDPTSLFASNVGAPRRMAAAETGDLYVIDDSQSRIVRVDATGRVSAFASDFGYLIDLVFGGNGELLVSGFDYQSGLATIWSFAENGERFTLVSEPEMVLETMTLGPDGDIWVAGCGMTCPSLRRYGPAGNLKEAIDISGTEWPAYLAFSPAGELHYTSHYNAVYKLANGTPLRVIQDVGELQGLAFDEDGYLYVANGSAGAIILFDPQYNRVADPFAFSNLSGPIDLVFGRDASGAMTSRLFAANLGWMVAIDQQYVGGIVEMNPAGMRAPGLRIGTDLLRIAHAVLDSARVGFGYADTLRLASAGGSASWSVVADELPPGITLNASTGVLSGVPEQAGDFTFGVRAQSGGDVGFARFKIVVSEPQLTTDDVIDAILGAPGLLTSELERFLDLKGNRNGMFDVGDVRAFLRSHGVIPADEAAEILNQIVRKVPNDTP